jgi:hypothetical protein
MQCSGNFFFGIKERPATPSPALLPADAAARGPGAPSRDPSASAGAGWRSSGQAEDGEGGARKFLHILATHLPRSRPDQPSSPMSWAMTVQCVG